MKFKININNGEIPSCLKSPLILVSSVITDVLTRSRPPIRLYIEISFILAIRLA